MTATILLGDCIERMRSMPDASVQCVVTSPPYWGLRDYGVDGQIGLESTPQEFLSKMVAVFAEVRRVLRDDGVCWVNMGDGYAGTGKSGGGAQGERWKSIGPDSDEGVGSWKPAPEGLKPKDLIGMPWRLAFALQADGWWLRSDCIWHKPNPMPESVTDRPTKAHEYVFLLTKAARYYYDADAVRSEPKTEGLVQGSPGGSQKTRDDREGASNDKDRSGKFCGVGGVNMRTVWTIPTQAFSGAHFATFPEELAARCIKAGTSAHGCCEACGAPWVRVVERRLERTPKACRNAVIDIRDETADANDQGSNRQRDGHIPGMIRADVTTGWKPSCSCAAPVTACTVFDPFTGSGTTGVVAVRLGRNFIGTELNPTYAEMARKRITDVEPMFTQAKVVA